jgi:Zn-dependent peptidase ImmA (M78 family)
MLTALDAVLPGQRADLTRDPITVLRDWEEISYRDVPPAEASSRCSVAGAYYGTEDPAVIAVTHAASPGRRAFTALYELGHHLQQSDFDLADAVDSHGAARGAFEDAACDAFAADVLLPDEIVDRHISAAGPSTDDVVALRRDSAASRVAVCVRAAQRLRAPGHVVLMDGAGVVQFAAAHLMPHVSRNSDQSRTAVVRQALAATTGRACGRTRFRYRDDIEGAELYAQAAQLDGYLIVVAVTDHARSLPFPQPREQRSPTLTPPHRHSPPWCL